MMNILYLVSRVPTGFSGREYILKQNLYFLKKNGYEIHLAYLGEEDDGKELLENNVVQHLLPLNKSTLVETFINLITKRDYSLQERLFFSKNAALDIEYYVTRNEIDLLLVDMIRMAPLIGHINSIKKYIEYDDLLSVRYSRMLNIKQSQSNPLGTFSEKFPKLFSQSVGCFSKWILRLEAKKMEERELSLISEFQKISFTSSLEANDFSKKIQLIGKNKPDIYSNPPCIKVDRENGFYKKIRDFVFVGNLKSNHNLACLENISIISSGLKDRGVTFSIDIFGDFDDRAIAICGTDPCIRLHGRVKDLDKELSSSKYLLSPFVFGTGIKIKIIEAMYNKTLVVTNSVGAEGIPIKNNIHFVQCESNEDYIDFIENISRNDHKSEFYDSLIEQAFRLVSTEYSEENVENNFMKFINL